MQRTTNQTNILKILFAIFAICIFMWLGLTYLNNRRPTIGGTAFVEEDSTGLFSCHCLGRLGNLNHGEAGKGVQRFS